MLERKNIRTDCAEYYFRTCRNHFECRTNVGKRLLLSLLTNGGGKGVVQFSICGCTIFSEKELELRSCHS